MKPQTLILSATLTLLTACGGSGGDGSGGDNNVTLVPPDFSNYKGAMRRTSTGEMMPEAYDKRMEYVQTLGVNYRQGSLKPSTITYNGKTLLNFGDSRLNIDFRSLPRGYLAATAEENNSNGRVPTRIRSYQGYYSGAYLQRPIGDGTDFNLTYGVYPLREDLPQSGMARYTGTAFDINDRGTLTYNIDFGKKEGAGSISGLSRFGDITLHTATLRPIDDGDFATYEITRGRATVERGFGHNYELKLYGPQAAELAGNLREDFDNDVVAAFYGSRTDR